MDCPECSRECGQNDKFCSNCGYKLCSARTPVTDSEYQEETTENRSSLDPEPAPETTSSCLAQSQPSSADPAKSDAKTGLVDSDNMDRTLSKDSKDTACTAQEEEDEAKRNDKLPSLFSRIEPSAPGRLKATDVDSRSVTLSWERPVSMEGVSYEIHITYGCEGEDPRSHICASNTTTAVLSDLKPGMEYNFNLTAVLPNGSSACVHTKPSAPGRVKATDVESRSVTLCWERPVSMEGVSYEIHITYGCEGEEPRSHICAPNTTTAALSDLKPGMEYNFNLTAVLPNGICSKTSSACVHTKPSAPGRVKATDVESRSVTLCWERPVSMEGVSYEIHITYGCEGEEPRSHICAPNTTTAALSDLKPGMEYNFNLTAVLPNGICSKTSSACVHTKPSAPGRVKATDVESRSVTLCWERPVSMEGVSYEIHITYGCEGEEPRSHICAPNTTTAALSDLKPGMEYNFNLTAVLPNGICSKTSSACVHTKPSAPGRVKATDVESRSVTLCWERPVSMEGVSYEIHITYGCEGEEPRSHICAPNTTTAALSDLKPGMEYNFNLTAVLPNGICSKTSSACVHTKPSAPGRLKATDVESSSVTLCWERPFSMAGVSYEIHITYRCEGEDPRSHICASNTTTAVLSDLKPGMEYNFNLTAVLPNGSSACVHTKPSAPGRVKATDVESRSVTLCWERPVSMEGVSYEIHITYGCEGEEPRSHICAPNTTTAALSDLKPGMEYNFNLTAVLPNGICSKTSSACVHTKPSAPGRLKATDVESSSVTLCWERPFSMAGVSYEIHITYRCEGEDPRSHICASNTTTAVLSDLKPGMEYNFNLTAVLPNGSSACVHTKPSAPGRLKATDVESSSVTLCWERPFSMAGVSYEIHITYRCEGEDPRSHICASNTTTAVLSDLKPGMEYNFNLTAVLPNGSSACVHTKPSAPGRVKATDVESRSVTLCWERPVSMEGVSYEIHITYGCEGEEPRSHICAPNTTTAALSDLKPGMEYNFNLTAVLPNGSSACVHTKPSAPGRVKATDVESRSVTLCWERPVSMEGVSYEIHITYGCEGEEPRSHICAPNTTTAALSDLKPGMEYNFNLTAVLPNGICSKTSSACVHTKPSAPGRVKATDVESRSVTLCWERPVSMEGVSYEIHITYGCEGEEPRSHICAPNTTTAALSDLKPGMEYNFNLTAVLPNGICSKTSSACVHTKPSAPGRVKATDVESRSVTLCWERPVSMEGVSYEIHITYGCEGEEPRSHICAPNTTTAALSDLKPGMEYNFNLTAVLPNGICSKTSSACVHTKPSAPGRVKATDVESRSVTLCWERPVSMEGVSYEIHITYGCEGEEPRSHICAPNTTTAALSDLKPGMEYNFNLTAVLPNGICSKTSSACVHTKPSAPGRVKATDVESRSVTLCWERPVSMEGVSYEIHITYGCEGEEPRSHICAPNTTTAALSDLKPGMEYNFNLTAVLPNGICSKTSSACVHTKPSAPGRVKATDVESRSVTLCWERPVSMEGVSYEIHITYGCEGEEPRSHICAPNTTTAALSDLKPGMEYNFNLTAVLPNGICSKTSSACVHTKPSAPGRVKATDVESRSVTLCWERPVSMEGVSYEIHITYGCEGEEPRSHICAPNTTTAALSDLKPGMEYNFNLTAVLPNGICSKTSSACVHTKPSAPGRVKATDVESRSVTLCWERPVSMEGVSYEIHITYGCEGEEPRSHICAPNTTTAALSDLKPGMEYNFNLTAVLPNGICSKTSSACVHTKPSAPGRVKATDVESRSVTLCWERPVSMEGVSYEIHITYGCEGEEPRSHICAPNTTTAALSDLKPGMEYNFNLTAVLPNGICSKTSSACVHTKPSAPGRVKATDVESRSVTLCWERPVSMEGVSYEIHITYGCEGEEPRSHICAPNTTTAALSDLKPGMEYNFNLTAVLPNGICSKTSSACVHTKPSAPGRVKATDVESRSVTLCWERPVSMEGVSYEIHITYGCEGEEPRSHICAPNTTTAALSDLKPGMEYNFNLTAVLPNGICSKTSSACVHTKPSAPGRVKATDVESRSVTLCWERPVSMEGVSYEIHITYGCEGEEPRSHICAPNITTAALSDLKPGMEYNFNLTAVLPNGICSKTSSACVHTKPSAPGRVKATDVESRSVTLCWERPVSMEGVSYEIHITYGCEGEEPRSHICAPNTTTAALSDLKPGMEYNFNLTAVLPNGICSKTSSACVHTKPSAPGRVKATDVESRSVTLCWERPVSMEGVSYEIHITYGCEGEEPRSHICAPNTTTAALSDLKPGMEYNFNLTAVLPNGICSKTSSACVHTKPSAPGRVKATDVESRSVTLCWERPVSMEGVSYEIHITYGCEGEEPRSHICAPNITTAALSDLKPGMEYNFNLTAVLPNGICSKTSSACVHTKPSAPGRVKATDVESRSVTLCWERPVSMEGVSYEIHITYGCEGEEPRSHICAPNTTTAALSDLKPGMEYNFNLTAVLPNGICSKTSSACVHTKPFAPGRVKATDVESRSVTLCWERPVSMEGVSYEIHITYGCEGEEPRSHICAPNTTTAALSDLKPGMEYNFNLTAVLPNGICSKTSSACVHTRTSLDELAMDLGLEHYLKNKLTLSKVLEIDGETLTDERIQSLKSLPWCFLRKLMMVNVTARSVGCEAKQDTLHNPQGHSNIVNPLDLITAIFLCSDGFLQQEMVFKMSMCQFSVPWLLPKCDAQECTLMLWAMRDIVKKYNPHSLKDPREFVEESIVHSDLPMVSFVRLGNSSLSKSHILNQVISNPQQYHDTFVHKNMDCSDTPRRISNGLVEISWYLPCGNQNSDVLSKPLAVTNLRGDLNYFKTQYSFLCCTSAAIFVFCDDFGSDCKLLDSQHLQAPWFLITNSESKSFKWDEFKSCVSELQLPVSNIIIKGMKMNDAEFIRRLRSAISDILMGKVVKKSVEQMSIVAVELGIHVDENYIPCQRGKQKADAITERISDIPGFKEKELPLQGTSWKQLAKLEKEECRLKNAGKKNIEVYKNELSVQKQELRAQQRAQDISESMSRFISAMSGSTEERKYFLKWMRINLDNLSRKSLSLLRADYKELCLNSSENKELIADLDRKISSCSLGTEHFLREMGQLYESACSLPEGPTSKIQLLPCLCAELLQEGFPLELVDGDASNIPLQWVTQVLRELHHQTQHECKIRVVTVLGMQSTGKSTLLNTMFGVQFAVSSGRCTRGAFMLLIRVKEDFKRQLGCDYIMVIDTEGLKSPELAQLDESYEHNNELATLVVGLSDITVINIAMENCTEMMDILQIVVHAFLRMTEVGRKPCCQFVHQNVPDISAHDNNMRDRKLLLEQLNEMTQAAAKMEKKGNNQKFTDVMEYDPERNNWYIPGLWHGTPPMAPVNAGYSESVNLFKRRVIEMFKESKSGKSSPHTFDQFLEWTKSLWHAVKYENFIFSFRNSLVADAYAQLCTEFNKWEWAYRKNMYSWLREAETKVSNAVMIAAQAQSSFNAANLLSSLKREASVELAKGEKIISDNLTEFYKRSEGHIYLVEKYKEDFISTAKTIRRETENSVTNKLEAALEIRKGMLRLESIKNNPTGTIEQKVLNLIEICRKTKDPSDDQLKEEFETMWNETVAKLEEREIVQDIHHQLRANLEREGSSVQTMLSKVGNLSECGKEPFEVNNFHDIIKCSKQFVDEKVRTRSDYHNTYMIELLGMVDEKLDRCRDLGTTVEFQASLKIHICGHAAREFHQMHLDFIQANDPRQCLKQFKVQYCTDFMDLFHKRNQCRKKAKEFTNNCLAPAVKEYITNSLGPELVDEVLTGKKAIDFSTRSFFQFSVHKKLLSEDNFEDFVNYTINYETCVQGWIFEQMVKQFTEGDGLRKVEIKQLNGMVQRLKEAVVNAHAKASERVAGRGEADQNIQQFIQDICRALHKDLVIPKDPLDVVLALNTAKPEDFSRCLMGLVDEMEQSFKAEFQKGGNVRARLTSLPFQPQKELFNRVVGCGKQCPFCKTPCEAGGKDHTEHFASIHRPQGIGRYRFLDSQKLVSDICSSCVASESKFMSMETEGEWHPYKDYQSIYPDWRIQPDTSIQASDYWKYIFNRFNKQFAKEYDAKPADIPPLWGKITKDQAMESLKESFQMKTGGD
ncbi:hypothetical protein SKAU_G00378950 [Synaphobranchus kaupii]|uniref:Uncharacterized protein n=1 Tax=Synaphobranchus kaupii TaxID=118154 RepID=A0A9Q1IDL8_SYNKA|nr:hypothetical protein SKAU_G00378950 [Synaphobranchus kaupii]